MKTIKQPVSNYWSLISECDTKIDRQLNREIRERDKENFAKNTVIPE